MTTALAGGLDQIVLVVAAVLWPAAAGFAYAAFRPPHDPRFHLAALALSAGAVVVSGVRVALTVRLLEAGWWFAAEKVLLALPLLLIPMVYALTTTLPALLRRDRDPKRAYPLILTAIGAVAGVACDVVVSSPVSPSSALVVLLVAGGAAALAWRLVAGTGGDRWRVAGFAVALTGVVWAITGSLSAPPMHAGHDTDAGGVSVASLRGPADPDARRYTLTARASSLTVGGRTVETWSFNGQNPGPALRVKQGETLEVTLRNELPGGQGVTIHWHGYDLPAGEDGVPGVTQDAVRPGGEHVYRFRADDPGTYWYHSHQNSSIAVAKGLFGLLIVEPAEGDHTVAIHSYGNVKTLAFDDRPPADGLVTADLPPGTPVRLRIAGTDSLPVVLGLSGVDFRLRSVDARDVAGATPLRDRRLKLAAGGRYDLAFTMPDGPVALSVEGHPGLALNGRAAPATGDLLDVTRYGTLPDLREDFDQEIVWVLDKTFAMVDGLPRLAHTVNGKGYPNIPTPVVREGERVRITIVNRSGDLHPMHPHGHHVEVLSRDGRPANGMLVDTFDVEPGEVWVVALTADNPGLWMSHCHDLAHAVQGMEFHVAYEGITTPFDVGGPAGNHPA
ncbi:multicopper oxidase family protein [Herbidospora daliensis]|uniref:multicopper oxidase family protein n=1 Tax=Herbidospora daliensis TaxID=295585 RepID=UPI000785B6B0|nr:multicopper oxidase family protein [Herbidospora daliensis]